MRGNISRKLIGRGIRFTVRRVDYNEIHDRFVADCISHAIEHEIQIVALLNGKHVYIVKIYSRMVPHAQPTAVRGEYDLVVPHDPKPHAIGAAVIEEFYETVGMDLDPAGALHVEFNGDGHIFTRANRHATFEKTECGIHVVGGVIFFRDRIEIRLLFLHAFHREVLAFHRLPDLVRGIIPAHIDIFDRPVSLSFFLVEGDDLCRSVYFLRFEHKIVRHVFPNDLSRRLRLGIELSVRPVHVVDDLVFVATEYEQQLIARLHIDGREIGFYQDPVFILR